MKIELAVGKRDELIQQLRAILPADKLNEVIENITHVCDLSFEAGRTLWAEREAFKKSVVS